jgi:hypothetical protein
MAAQTFANTGEDVISQSIDLKSAETPKHGTKEFENFYDIERTARAIEDGDYKRVRT